MNWQTGLAGGFALLLLAGCSQGGKSLTGPSEGPVIAAENQAGTNNWTGNKKGKKGAEDSVSESSSSGPGSTNSGKRKGKKLEGLESEIRGPIGGLSGNCPALSFTIAGFPVTTSVLTEFEGGCAGLTNGTVVKVEGQVQNGVLIGREVERDEGHAARPEIEITGAVQSVAGGCPNLTLVVNGVQVHTNASTEFSPSCAAVAAATHVKVEGPPSNGNLLAREIEAAPAPVAVTP